MTDPLAVAVPGADDMVRLGRMLGGNVFKGAVLGLRGPMGAGKTTLVSGLAQGMKIRQGYTVSSPTYTIMQRYPCLQGDLFHLDLYRITGFEDLESTGYRDAIGPEAVLVVEWVDREPEVLPAEHLLVELEYQNSGRLARFSPTGSRYTDMLARSLEKFRKS